jgi:hypothetical protein
LGVWEVGVGGVATTFNSHLQAREAVVEVMVPILFDRQQVSQT